MHLSADTLAAIREWLQIARLGAVVIFAILGIRICRTSEEPRRRRRINHLLLYVVALHLVLAVVQTDAWPFSNYPMMTVDLSDRERVQRMPVFRAVDQRGDEWQIDPNAWSPLYPENMTAWMYVVGPTLKPEDRQAALRYLLHRAESARQLRVNGRSFIGNAALLGPLAAPDVDVLPDVPVSPLPFRALRLYMQEWRPSEFAHDRRHVAWHLEEEVTD